MNKEENASLAPDTSKPRCSKKRILLIAAISFIAISLLTLLFLHIADRLSRAGRGELFEGELIPVQLQDGYPKLWGYLSLQGEMIIPPKYIDAKPFAPNGLAAVKKDGKWGFVDKSGTEVIRRTFDNTLGFEDGNLAPVKKDGLWGFVNKKGELAIPYTYKEVKNFSSCGLAAVRVDELYGFINEDGEMVIEPKFVSTKPFDEGGLAAVKTDANTYCLINKKGEYVLPPEYNYIGEFSSCGLAPAQKKGKVGYINREGKFVIPPTFDNATGFDENGLAIVSKFGEYSCYINTKGEVVISPQCNALTPFAENGLAAVATARVITPQQSVNQWRYINKKGETVLGGTFLNAYPFAAGLAAVRDENGWRYINEKGETVFTPSPNCIRTNGFGEDGYAVVSCIDEESGEEYVEIIDTTGKVIHEMRLHDAGPIGNYSGRFLSSLDKCIKIGYNSNTERGDKNG